MMRVGKRHERAQMAQELFGLGFSYAEIAELMKASIRTVRRDVEKAGETEHKRPTGEEKFRTVFLGYATLEYHEVRGGKPLYPLIREWLGVERVIDHLSSVVITMDRLGMPIVRPEQIGYLSLLRVVFAARAGASTESEEHHAQGMWRDYVSDVVRQEREPPTDSAQLLEQSTDYVINKLRGHIAPIWPEHVTDEIDRVMAAALTPREHQIIACQYRLSGYGPASDVPRNYVEIGKRFKLTSSSTRTRALSAFYKLRRSVRFGEFRALLFQSPFARLPQKTSPFPDVYRLSVEEVGLTFRPAMLTDEGVHCVGQLIQMTERDVRRIRGFGSRYVQNIKDQLVELGKRTGIPLQLGTFLEPDIREAFEAAITHRG